MLSTVGWAFWLRHLHTVLSLDFNAPSPGLRADSQVVATTLPLVACSSGFGGAPPGLGSADDSGSQRALLPYVVVPHPPRHPRRAGTSR